MRNKFILVFGILYLLVFSVLMTEKFVLDNLRREILKVDRAFYTGSELAAETVSKHMYEDGLKILLEAGFSYAYSASYSGTNDDGKTSLDAPEFLVFINGERADFKDLYFVKENEPVTIMIRAGFCTDIFGRKFRGERTALRQVKLFNYNLENEP